MPSIASRAKLSRIAGLWRVLAACGALLGTVGTAGLAFDGSFQARSMVITAPLTLAAAFAAARISRGWSQLLLGLAFAGFGIEANTAYVNHDGCIGAEALYRGAGVSNPVGQCSPIGLYALGLATVTLLIAGILSVAEERPILRRGVLWLGGVVLAPLVLYLLSVAAFVISRH